MSGSTFPALTPCNACSSPAASAARKSVFIESMGRILRLSPVRKASRQLLFY